MPLHVDLNSLPEALLAWYERHARELPWRVGPAARARGERPDPYHVWLSEIMLQQTTIPHGTPYFLKFLKLWPSVSALAAARDEDIMREWAGLGYYARARNLLKCAREVSARGGFPETASELARLPGIGPYTAGAIAALAFGQPAAAVDGNVDRVFARLLALKAAWKEAKRELAGVVAGLVPTDRPGAFAEALMDLGATVCTPKAPNCPICPLKDMCRARAEGTPERYPVKPAKAKQPVRQGTVYVLVNKGQVLLERRPEKGLLGGMLGLPTTAWSEDTPAPAPPAEADWQALGEVRHVFTHFALRLNVLRAEQSGRRKAGLWVAVDEVDGLPSVFAKAWALALAG